MCTVRGSRLGASLVGAGGALAFTGFSVFAVALIGVVAIVGGLLLTRMALRHSAR